MKRVLIIAGLGFVTIFLALGGLGVWWLIETLKPGPTLSKRLTVTDPEVAKLIDHLEGKDEDKRIEAAEALGRMGQKAIDPLRKALKDKNAGVRFNAVQALVFMEPDVLIDATDALMPLLKDDDASVRYKTVFALGKIGTRSAPAVVGVITALSDKDESVKDTAIEVVEKLDAPPKEAVPELAKLAGKGTDYAIRSKVIILLGKAGAPAAPVFKNLLKDADPLATIEIVHAMAPLGAHAKLVLPELQAVMVKKRDFWDSEEELIAIFKKCGADGGGGLVAVLKILHDPKSPDFAPGDSRTRTLLKAIGEMGSDAQGATAVLIDMLKVGDRWNTDILEALGGIGPAAKDAIPAVQALLTTRFEPEARVALKRMGVMDEKKK